MLTLRRSAGVGSMEPWLRRFEHGRWTMQLKDRRREVSVTLFLAACGIQMLVVDNACGMNGLVASEVADYGLLPASPSVCEALDEVPTVSEGYGGQDQRSREQHDVECVHTLLYQILVGDDSEPVYSRQETVDAILHRYLAYCSATDAIGHLEQLAVPEQHVLVDEVAQHESADGKQTPQGKDPCEEDGHHYQFADNGVLKLDFEGRPFEYFVGLALRRHHSIMVWFSNGLLEFRRRLRRKYLRVDWMLSSSSKGFTKALRKNMLSTVRISPSSSSLDLNTKNIEKGMRAVLKKNVVVSFVMREVNLPVRLKRPSLLDIISRAQDMMRLMRDMMMAHTQDRYQCWSSEAACSCRQLSHMMSPKLTQSMNMVSMFPARMSRYLDLELTYRFSHTISLGSMIGSKPMLQPLILMLPPRENTLRSMVFHSAILNFFQMACLTSADSNDTNTLSVRMLFSWLKQNLLIVGSISYSQERISSSSLSTSYIDILCRWCYSFDFSPSLRRSAFRYVFIWWVYSISISAAPSLRKQAIMSSEVTLSWSTPVSRIVQSDALTLQRSKQQSRWKWQVVQRLKAKSSRIVTRSMISWAPSKQVENLLKGTPYTYMQYSELVLQVSTSCTRLYIPFTRKTNTDSATMFSTKWKQEHAELETVSIWLSGQPKLRGSFSSCRQQGHPSVPQSSFPNWVHLKCFRLWAMLAGTLNGSYWPQLGKQRCRSSQLYRLPQNCISLYYGRIDHSSHTPTRFFEQRSSNAILVQSLARMPIPTQSLTSSPAAASRNILQLPSLVAGVVLAGFRVVQLSVEALSTWQAWS